MANPLELSGQVNGTPVVFNNCQIALNGSTDFSGWNGYIVSVSWSKGNLARNTDSMTQDGDPLTNNVVLSNPSGTFTVMESKASSFRQTFSRYKQITISLQYYVTGAIEQGTQTILISNARLSEFAGSSNSNSTQNNGTYGFVATNIQFI